MVKKGLKVGDTFADGGLLYKITSIDGLGRYVSSLVGKASEETNSKEEEPLKEDSIEDMPYSELKKLAKEKGVSAKGSKEEVLERLRGM